MARVAILTRIASLANSPMRDTLRYGALIHVSTGYSPGKGRFHTRYAPVRHSRGPKPPTVRLACIRPAASVHPEPGSNSPLYKAFNPCRSRGIFAPASAFLLIYRFQKFRMPLGIRDFLILSCSISQRTSAAPLWAPQCADSQLLASPSLSGRTANIG